MNQIVARHSPLPLVAARPRASIATRALTLLFVWLERARSRRQLGQLDDRMLADIGIDRATARHELEAAFWRESPSARRAR